MEISHSCYIKFIILRFCCIDFAKFAIGILSLIVEVVWARLFDHFFGLGSNILTGLD